MSQTRLPHEQKPEVPGRDPVMELSARGSEVLILTGQKVPQLVMRCKNCQRSVPDRFR